MFATDICFPPIQWISVCSRKVKAISLPWSRGIVLRNTISRMVPKRFSARMTERVYRVDI